MTILSPRVADVLVGVLTVVMVSLVFHGLWRSAALEKATSESGRKIFPPTRALRIFAGFFAVVFAALFVFSYSMRRPEDGWVPYLFLAFLLIPLFMIPPVLIIEVDGVESRTWLGREKKIRWEDIASLHYNTGNRQFTVKSVDGRKITHAGFNVDRRSFQDDVHRHTRLPLKVVKPGTWKAKTFEVLYEEIEADLNERG